MPEMSVAQNALDHRSAQPNPQRRCVTFGLVSSLLSVVTGGHAAAQASEVPFFRSGRFQFTILQPKQTLPSITLFPLKRNAIDLASYRGHPILLNFWATWCDACRLEMPILDRLQTKYRNSVLKIIAVSEDRDERAVVDRFVNKLKIQSLKIYMDPNGYVAFSDAANKRSAPFALYGMPITYAIAASGWIVGYMPGATDWTSAAAGNLIEFLHHS